MVRVKGTIRTAQMEFPANRDAGEMDATAMRRVASSQATLRRLNEAIEAERADGVVVFRCECGELGCNRLIPLRQPEYEAVRADPRRFVIAPGHVISALEYEVE